MLSYHSKRLTQPLEPPARALDIPSPITGQPIELPEDYPAFIRHGLFGQGVGVLATAADVISPFKGKIVQQDPADYSLQFLATNGLRLYIKLAATTVSLYGEQLFWHKRLNTPCDAGERLVSINPMWLKSQQIAPICFVGIVNAQKLQGFYPSSLRNLSAFHDRLMTLFF